MSLHENHYGRGCSRTTPPPYFAIQLVRPIENTNPERQHWNDITEYNDFYKSSLVYNLKTRTIIMLIIPSKLYLNNINNGIMDNLHAAWWLNKRPRICPYRLFSLLSYRGKNCYVYCVHSLSPISTLNINNIAL